METTKSALCSALRTEYITSIGDDSPQFPNASRRKIDNVLCTKYRRNKANASEKVTD